jgi:molecular chaperone GrpE
MTKANENTQNVDQPTNGGEELNANSNTATADKQNAELTVEDCMKQIAELKDKYLRQAAEFDNYRKRVLKEKSELILNGGSNVITSLLPVLDDFQRITGNFPENTDDALTTGIMLVYRKFIHTLETCGLKAIDTKDEDFNTDYHEAVALIPAPTPELKGKVVDCLQPGYKLNDKVLRHAKVAIGQ